MAGVDAVSSWGRPRSLLAVGVGVVLLGAGILLVALPSNKPDAADPPQAASEIRPDVPPESGVGPKPLSLSPAVSSPGAKTAVGPPVTDPKANLDLKLRPLTGADKAALGRKGIVVRNNGGAVVEAFSGGAEFVPGDIILRPCGPTKEVQLYVDLARLTSGLRLGGKWCLHVFRHERPGLDAQVIPVVGGL